MPSGRAFAFAVAVGIWLTIFRLIAGGACVVDGISKLGWLPHTPASRDTGDFQPSPLGPASPVLEIVAGAFVLAGLRCRTASLVLLAHFLIGLLLVKLRDPRPSRNTSRSVQTSCFWVRWRCSVRAG